MECPTCEQTRKDFICSSCLSRDLHAHHTALTRLSSERDLLVAKASASLEPLQKSRGRRADVAALRARLDDIQLHTRKLREENEEMRERIASMRAMLAGRRTSLDEAHHSFDESPPRTPTPTPPGGPPRRRPPTPPQKQDHMAMLVTDITSKHIILQDELAKARQGLVHELVDVFSVVEVGGRPASGVRAGIRGDWSIGGLVLPVPGDMRRFAPAHVNAALTFTVQFIGLLSFYLGVKLPFEVTWSGGKFGVGIPEICAGRGGEGGAWARWTARCPLHVPLNPSSGTNGSPPHSPSPAHQPSLPSPYTPSPLSASTRTRRDSLSASTHSSVSFPTALAMLSYNTAYLAYTQGLDVSLSLAASGALLPTLWGVCCSAELGRKSHSTGFNANTNINIPGAITRLPPPTHGFALDFRQLLQAQATAADQTPMPPRVRIPRGRDELTIEEEDGWEVVEEA
ncbi:uncharacterized protein FOMMEDRAFT_165803 [Fomitiporia mediterranea MF3/22]|uniref:uncharacterized protein n=1 Tax=Fomitiporia mediterranea (strain MF3/22) TaxID=694068 RepID=UPI0004408234|nr:uncharacterized protein FOMMEDRAFT_165803 [Fomitiporia mediterranea MF3/22]EJD05349.1 hypothetical protein FOMMEDRAFT_165803 [Fomitiporia mediterranea MF3/22]